MLRFGVVGTSWITDRLIEAGSGLPNFALTAVYSRSAEKAALFARKYNVEQWFTSLDEMASSESIDAVYIASPNALHAQQSEIFLRAGKAVLVEKPMAVSEQEMLQLIECARTNQVLLMEAMKTTYTPTLQLAEQLLPKIGRVQRFMASYGQFSSKLDALQQGQVANVFDPQMGGGSLLDLGVYCVYPVVKWFGMPKRILANGQFLATGVDGAGSLILDYDGMEAVLMHSKLMDSHVPVEIVGERGVMLIDRINPPQQIEIRYLNGEREQYQPEQAVNTMVYELAAFIELVETGQVESDVNRFEHSLHTVMVMEAARKQMEQGRES